MAKQEQLDHSFDFRRLKETGRVVVSNSLNYVMAEYDERTGVTRWQRVVSASQKEQVQKWLQTHYPVKVEAVVAAPKAVKKQRRAA